MQNETAFPSTRQDLSNLKQTAVDAAADIKSTASVHASKAKAQLNDLAGHAKDEAQTQLNEVKGSLEDVVDAGRNYVAANPLWSLGFAFGAGILFAITFRGRSNA